MIVCVTIIIIVIIAFVIKSFEKKDTSITNKIIAIIKKEYPLLLLSFGIYLMYCYHSIISNSKVVEFNVVIDLLCDNISLTIKSLLFFIGKVLDTLMSESILKIIVIGYITSKILNNEGVFERFKSIFCRIGKIQYKDFLIENVQKEINDLEEKAKNRDIDPKEAKIKINNKKLKKELMALMIDNDILVKYLTKFIVDEVPSIKIPKNLIPRKVRVYEIEKIFIYEASINSIKLTGINPDLEEIISETYHELIDKEIVCYTN